MPPPFASGHSGPPPRGGGEGAREARVRSRGPLQGSGPVAQRTEAEGERRPAAGGWCRRRARRHWRSGRASATPILPPPRGLRWSRPQLQSPEKTARREPGRRPGPGRPEEPAGSCAAWWKVSRGSASRPGGRAPRPQAGREVALLTRGAGRARRDGGLSSLALPRCFWAIEEPDPTLLWLGARRIVGGGGGGTGPVVRLCFTSLYLGILVRRVACFPMRKFGQRSQRP